MRSEGLVGRGDVACVYDALHDDQGASGREVASRASHKSFTRRNKLRSCEWSLDRWLRRLIYRERVEVFLIGRLL